MACKANCCCCKCTKKTARHKRTKKKSANGQRPFAPFYSTSTISKAVNSVYGPPMPITRTSYMPGEHRGGPPELKPEIALSFRDTPLTNHPEHGGAFASLMANHGLDSVGQATRGGDANAMQTTTAHVHQQVNNHGVDIIGPSSTPPKVQSENQKGKGVQHVGDTGMEGFTFNANDMPTNTPYMIGRNGKPTRNWAPEWKQLTGVEQSTRQTPPPTFMEKTPIGNSFSPHPTLTKRRTAGTTPPLEFTSGKPVYDFGKGGTALDFDKKTD